MSGEIDPLDALETTENRMDDVTHLLSEKQLIWIELHAATQDAYCSWVPRWRWNLYRKQQPNLDCVESLNSLDQLRAENARLKCDVDTNDKEFTKMVLESQITIARLRQDNARLNSEVESEKMMRELDKTVLQAYKDALEKARVFSLKQHQMLRAFRKSMDSNLPFPSLEKLTEVINEHATINELLQKVSK